MIGTFNFSKFYCRFDQVYDDEEDEKEKERMAEEARKKKEEEKLKQHEEEEKKHEEEKKEEQSEKLQITSFNNDELFAPHEPEPREQKRNSIHIPRTARNEHRARFNFNNYYGDGRHLTSNSKRGDIFE